jgi:histidine triad (HIT) family protein
MEKDGCLFCSIAKKQIPSKIVYEDDSVLAFEDVKPQAPVHILIIPKRHIENTSDLSEKEAALAGHLVVTAKKIAEKYSVDTSGYRIVLNCNKDAGQEVLHLHLHLMGGRKFSWPPG